MKFCAKTKGLSEDENKQFAKDLKKFTKQETEKFKDEEPKEDEE